MKSKFTKVLIFTLIAVLLFGTVSVSAFDAYETYTYSIDGEPMQSPHAYTATAEMSLLQMGVDSISSGIRDIATDEHGNVYLVDSNKNRIIVLDRYYQQKAVITGYVDKLGNERTFNAPEGIYVTDSYTADGDKHIYICDTGNAQIVILDEEYNCVDIIYSSIKEQIPGGVFDPTAIAVDLYGRIFITGSDMYRGIAVFANDCTFTGLIGAQKVTVSLLDKIWNLFRPESANTDVYLSVGASNLTVDEYGFVYATYDFSIAASDSANLLNQQRSAIKSKTAAYSPVKKLNSMGKEIMKRNGFFDPSGEVAAMLNAPLSTIKDVAVGPGGTWTILDSNTQNNSRFRTFTYNSNGDLLFAFGDVGSQLGNCEDPVGIAYQKYQIEAAEYDDDGYVTKPAEYEYRLLILDNILSQGDIGNKLVVYSPTEYCSTIISAIENENAHKYSHSIEYWQEVLTKNNNFDLAYIGIGKALYNQGRYEEAKEYLEVAYETEVWSKAENAIGKEFTSKWLLLIVVLVIVALVFFFKFLGWAKKKNKATALKVGRKSYGEELLYICHLIFHPFDGFWDLKHEKRGSVRAATTILAATILAFFYQSVGQGYSFNPRGTSSSILVQLAAVLLPAMLFVVGNWCLTTLFDGEGSFKDIYVAACYALAPLPVFVILSTVLTNIVTGGSIVSLLVTIGYVWVGILLFFGMVVTHDYSIGKNIITILGTVVAMLVIMFVAVLFSALVVKMTSFIIALVSEIVVNMS